MSNYLVAVLADASAERVRQWLAHASSAGEHVMLRLRGRRHLLIVGAGATGCMAEAEYFRGTLVADPQRQVAFGLDGWRRLPERTRSEADAAAGEFVHVGWTPDRVSITRDVFGNVRLFHTAGRGFAAASDSLLLLASLRRRLGAATTADEEPLLARAALSQRAGQQISPDTIVREIRFEPPGCNVDLQVRRLRPVTTGTPVTCRFGSFAGASERDVIRAAAGSIVGLAAGLGEVDGWTPLIRLSGGLDSRLVLAAMVAAGVADRSVASRSERPDAARDNGIAVSLTQHFGLRGAPSGGMDAPSALADPWAFSRWGAAQAGAYDALGFVRARRPHPRTFELGGYGAGIHKGAWDWTDLAGVADAAVAAGGPVHDALQSQLAKSAESLRIDPSDPGASELYYLGYRNGLHSPADHIAGHMTGFAPLQQLRLVELAQRRGKDGLPHGSPATFLAMTALLCPEAVLLEYDTPRHDWTAADVEATRSQLGGELTRIEREPYEILGDPSAMPEGPSDLSLSAAAACGMTGPISADAAFDYAASRVEQMVDPVREQYIALEANARWRLGKADGDVYAAELPLTRLMMLGVVRPD